MALGGGTFLTQNKVLPGAYINFVSKERARVILADRGYVAIPYVGDWGPEDRVVEITNGDFQKHSLKLFGYDYTHPQVQMFRELFKNARVVYGYRLNYNAQKASNQYATALYGGSRGNALKLVIQPNVDEEGAFDVQTLLDGSLVDSQTVASGADLLDNDFVVFKKDAALEATAGMPFSGGTDGTGRSGENYQRFLDRIEGYSFNALGCNTDEKTVIDLFISFTKRMREEVGAKFQTVVYRGEYADHEGIVSVENKLLNVDKDLFGEFSLVYWVTGAIGGCAVNASLMGNNYDGEYEIDVNYTQNELIRGIEAGKFMFHRNGDDISVLTDINTLTTVTNEKGESFKKNQTVRVMDQIGNDIARIFNKQFAGIAPNNNAGRISLWSAIVRHHEQLQEIQAIQEFDEKDVVVEQGEEKDAVVVQDAVSVVNAMEKLYMTVVIE